MKVYEEKKIEMSSFSVDLDEKEEKILYELGAREILKDRKEVINYAFNCILKDAIAKEKEGEILWLRKSQKIMDLQKNIL